MRNERERLYKGNGGCRCRTGTAACGRILFFRGLGGRRKETGAAPETACQQKYGYFLILDLIAITIASFASIWIRYEFQFDQIEERFVDTVLWYLPVNMVVTVVVYYLFSLYTTLWKYAGITELCNITAAAAVSSILQVLGMVILGKPIFRSYVLLYFVLLLAATVATRFSYRFLRLVRNKYFRASADRRMNLMVVGAGDAGAR